MYWAHSNKDNLSLLFTHSKLNCFHLRVWKSLTSHWTRAPNTFWFPLRTLASKMFWPSDDLLAFLSHLFHLPFSTFLYFICRCSPLYQCVWRFVFCTSYIVNSFHSRLGETQKCLYLLCLHDVYLLFVVLKLV